jgi:hypothetical protein
VIRNDFISCLYDMRQFMGKQPFSLVRFWRIPPCAKYHVLPHGVRLGIHGPRRLGRTRAGMHPHLAEVVAEAGFEEGADRGASGWPGEDRTSWTTAGAASTAVFPVVTRRP